MQKTYSFSFLTALLIITVVLPGCTGENDGYMGWDDDRTDFGGVFESGKTRTTVKNDIYLAPNTTIQMTKKRAVEPIFIKTIYYDTRRKKYVGITRDGRRYIMAKHHGRFVATEEDTVIIRSGDTPGRVIQEYSSETNNNRQGIIIK